MKNIVTLKNNDLVTDLLTEEKTKTDLNILCSDGRFCCSKYLFTALFPLIGSLAEFNHHQDDELTISIPGLHTSELQTLFNNIFKQRTTIHCSYSVSGLLRSFTRQVDKDNEAVKPEILGKVEPKNSISEEFVEENDIVKLEAIHSNADTDSDDEPDFHGNQMNEDVDTQDSVTNLDDLPVKVTFAKKKRIRKYKPRPPKLGRVVPQRFKFKKPHCQVCEMKFVNGEQLYRHVFKLHGPKQEKVECSLCNKQFYKIEEKFHREICVPKVIKSEPEKKESKLYPCKECGKVFFSYGSLYYHRKIEHEPVACTCEICGQEFSNKMYLSDHITRNHNRRRKTCELCGKSIRGDWKGMTEHILAFHPETASTQKIRATCRHCGRQFASNDKYYIHVMNNHLQLKPYRCRYGCDIAYNDRSNRNSHEKKSHGGLHPDKSCDPSMVSLMKEHGYA